MNQAQTDALQALFVIQYSKALLKVRKAQKGLRLQYLEYIILVGSNSGATCGEIAKINSTSNQCAYIRLLRIIKQGFIYKEAKRYYLTDSGLRAYNGVKESFGPALNEIVKHLTKEARKRG